MKILHVIPTYEPAWACGGTVSATSSLCRALARQGVDVTVYATDADGQGGHLDVPLNRRVDLGGVKVWYFHCGLGASKAFYSRGLSKKLSETITNFDIVHVSAVWQWMQVDVSKICRMTGKPFVVSPHGSFSSWPWEQSKFKKRIYWHLFGKHTIRNAAAIHFTTEDERNKTFLTVPVTANRPSFIVPNGIEISKRKVTVDVRSALNISKNKILLLYAGRVHRQKGIHHILGAIEKLRDKQFVFLILGNTGDAKYLKKLSGFMDRIGDQVIWHKSVDRDEVWDFYNAADIFVLPSYAENFGMSVVEAMSAGVPVMISKNVGIWQEVFNSHSGFVAGQNADEICGLFRKISNDRGILKTLSVNARNLVCEKYDINETAALSMKAYENILTGRQNPELQWK